MYISYAEFLRSAPDVLRMIGSVYGHADDAVECLVWTQAALGRGYQVIAATDALGLSSKARPSVVADERRYSVAMDRLPLILYAARLADLAIAETSSAAPLSICATSCVGAWVAPYTAARIAAAGLQAFVAWRPIPHAPDEPSPSVIVAAPGEAPVVASAGSWGTPPSHDIAQGLAPDGLSATLLDGPPGSLVVVAGEPAAGLNRSAAAWGLASKLGFEPAELAEIDFAASLRTMISDGSQIDESSHTIWQTVAARIRLPTSERSRGQAG